MELKEYAGVIRYGLECRKTAEALPDLDWELKAVVVVAQAFLADGNLEEAQSYFQTGQHISFVSCRDSS